MNYSNINPEILYRQYKKQTQNHTNFTETPVWMLKSGFRFKFPHAHLNPNMSEMLLNSFLHNEHNILNDKDHNKFLEKLIKTQEDINETINHLIKENNEPAKKTKKNPVKNEEIREEITSEKKSVYEIKLPKNQTEPTAKKLPEQDSENKNNQGLLKEKADLKNTDIREIEKEQNRQNELKQTANKDTSVNIEFQKSVLNQSLAEKMVSEKLSAEKFVKDNQNKEIEEKRNKKGFVESLETIGDEKKKVRRKRGNKQNKAFNSLEQDKSKNKENINETDKLRKRNISVILGILLLIAVIIAAFL